MKHPLTPLPMRFAARVLTITLLLTSYSTLGAQHAEHSVPGTTAGLAASPTPSAMSDSAMLLYREAFGPFTRNAGSASRDAQSYFETAWARSDTWITALRF